MECPDAVTLNMLSAYRIRTMDARSAEVLAGIAESLKAMCLDDASDRTKMKCALYRASALAKQAELVIARGSTKEAAVLVDAVRRILRDWQRRAEATKEAPFCRGVLARYRELQARVSAA